MDLDDAMTKKSIVKFGEELAYSGDGTKENRVRRCSFLGPRRKTCFKQMEPSLS